MLRKVQIRNIVCASLLAAAASSSVAELIVEDAYVRSPLPGRSMTAAFLTLKNTGDQDIVLSHAELEGASSVEMHTHTHKDGVMRMRQIPELKVPAGGELILEPGGLHLMIFGVKELSETPQLVLCDDQKNCHTQNIEKRELIKK